MGVTAATACSDAIENSFEAGREAAEAILAQIELQQNSAAIVFCSIELELEELLRGIRSKLDIPMVGGTTYSEATQEGYTEDSVTLMVVTSDDLEVGVGCGEQLNDGVKDAVDRAWAQAVDGLSSPPKLVLTFPDSGLTGTGDEVLQAVLEHTKGEIPVVGGCTGDGGRFEKTFQIANDRVLTNSVPLLLLSGDIRPIIVTKTGWNPMGQKAIATKVEGTVLQEVDGKPAIEYIRRYVGNVDDPDIMGTFPIALFDQSIQDQGDVNYVIRSPFFYSKEDGSVTYGGPITQDCALQVGRASRESVESSARAAAHRISERAGDVAPTCALFISCGARKLMMGAAIDKEVATLREELGELPIAGFYSYGEIGAFDSSEAELGKPRFHNNTLVVCAL